MIVVTAPTGQIGSRTLERLVAAGARVRVIVRDASRLRASVREAVEVVEGSHGDVDVLMKAFAGAESVFWLAPPNPRAESVEDAYSGFSRPAAQALAAQGVQRVVAVSVLGRGTPMAENAGYITASLAMDDLLISSGVGYRALAMPSFMENVLRQTDLIRDQGVITSPIAGGRRMPFCAVRDIAAAAAELLLDGTWSGVEEVPLLGAEDLSFEDMAQIMSEVLERPVRFRQVSGEEFTARMTRSGASAAMARGALDMAIAKEAGMDNAVPRTVRTTTPTSFRQWCQEVLKPAVLG
ncbi:NAD(P)H-binding protein [Streptomyces sp. NPDC046977]|uniref:NmrA family NAD(P)-binding protein n=1 Tax=Streptomyces sp. NPDC046977 TaxID=3154703 RepID=UPI0033C31E44